MSSTETKPTCRVIPSGSTFHGKQGLDYFAGIAAETTGSRAICMHLLTIPPGGRANAHLHERHETAIYVLSGTAEMWHGDGLNLPANASESEPCSAVLARTDPNEQDSVVLLPELDAAPRVRPS